MNVGKERRQELRREFDRVVWPRLISTRDYRIDRIRAAFVNERVRLEQEKAS